MGCEQAFRAYTVDICVDDIWAKKKVLGSINRFRHDWAREEMCSVHLGCP